VHITVQIVCHFNHLQRSNCPIPSGSLPFYLHYGWQPRVIPSTDSILPSKGQCYPFVFTCFDI